jgi:cytochrome c oxidase assembly protein Cox11
MDIKFHKHQVIDWDYMQGQIVMEGLLAKFQACGLYEFICQRTDFNELTVKQFFATTEINIEDQLIV